MHKTVTASIGASNFIIEEAAYAELEKYLASIRKHFKASDDAEEIIADIEARLGEEFAEKLGKKRNVILLKDVKEVTRTMGTVEDFEEFEKGDSEPKAKREPFEWRKLRLYRDADDQIIGGVAAGIAHFFAIDPLIVRLIFGLSIFVGGFGVLLYILLWILLPEARTTTQKVEMTGGRVTLTTIQERIDRALPPDKRNGIIRKTIAFPFAILRSILTGIGRVLRFVLPLLGRIIGFFVALGVLFALAMLTFLLLALVLNPASPYIGIPLDGIAGTASYVFFLLGAYFLVFIPLVFILLLATSLAAMRSHLSLPTVASLGTLWFVALTTAAFTASTLAPQLEVAIENYRIEYGTSVSQTFDLADFTGVDAKSTAQVFVTQGEEYSVEVQAPQDILDRMELSVTDGTLTIGQNYYGDRCVIFCRRNDIVVRIVMPELRNVDFSGAVRATVTGFADNGEFNVVVDGVSRAEFADFSMLIVNADISGIASLKLMGTGSVLHATISGPGSLEAYDFPVAIATIDIDGPGHASLYSFDSITGSIDGPGRVYHKIEPMMLDIEHSGPARVELREDDRIMNYES